MTNTILSNVKIGTEFRIGFGNIIGIKRERLNVKYARDPLEERRDLRTVTIGDRCVICNYTLIYEGVTLRDDNYVDDYVRIGADTSLGSGTMLLYGAKLYERITIGKDCRIAGFVPNDVVMGHRVTMMGFIAHKYNRPLDWSRNEPSPVLEDDVVVGMNATVVGPIRIGRNSYIAAGAIITKDVKPDCMVLNTNEIMTLDEFENRKRKSRI